MDEAAALADASSFAAAESPYGLSLGLSTETPSRYRQESNLRTRFRKPRFKVTHLQVERFLQGVRAP
jgi:hypothetical protein